MLVLCYLPAVAAALVPISQEFLSNSSIPLGSIVSLRQNSSSYVDIADTSNTNNILGIVISADSSPLTLSTTETNRVQIATTGLVPVLASNINGEVQVGDQITASPIGGVGMKATGNVKVVGIAQGNLAGSSHTQQQMYMDKNKRQHTILLGQIPILVNVAYYFKQPDKTLIPPALQNLANALASKTVNPIPIIISMAIFLVTLLIVVTLIFTMIHGSIISVGRNPMAQAAVYRNLIQLSGLVILILAVAVVAIYFILTRF
jgi:hypothetical protein